MKIINGIMFVYERIKKFEKYKCYLVNGIYQMCFIQHHSVWLKIGGTKYNKSHKKKIFFVKIFKSKRKFNGDELILGTNDSAIIVSENRNIATFIQSRQSVENTRCFVRNMYAFFETPRIYEIGFLNSQEGYCVEQYLRACPVTIEKDSEIITQILFRCYGNYFRSIKGCIRERRKIGELLKLAIDSCEEENVLPLLRQIKFKSDFVDEVSYPVVILHNDLHFENFIQADNHIYLIDYEYCGENIFYYDLFSIFLNDFIYHNNAGIAFSFFEGKYDKQIREMFDIMGMCYFASNKMDYARSLVVLRYFIYKRVHKRFSDDEIVLLENFINFIDDYEKNE